MSTDLSERTFSESTHDGFLDSIFDRLRIGLRDAAKFVRMEAAWRTWPTVLQLSQSLQESLTTEADIEATRQGWVHSYAERCARLYEHEGFLGDMTDPKRRAHVASVIGGLGDDFDDPNAEITLDEVLAVYRAEYAEPTPADFEPVTPSAGDIAYEQDMDGWAVLNQAVGGDLWTNPDKAAVMRRLDAEMPDASWEEFHNAVVTQTAHIGPTVTGPQHDNP